MHEVCPNCGYCPVCGRTNPDPAPTYVPWPPTYVPWSPAVPTITLGHYTVTGENPKAWSGSDENA